jgi:AcrR family transcriptional regulator
MATKSASCKRPYTLGKRLERSDDKRARILGAARTHLESSGFQGLTLDLLARKAGVTRQTVYNLFGTKSGVLEGLFDQLAGAGGMSRMPEVMRLADRDALLAQFVKIFTAFWSKDRLFLRRIHGLAAIDPELGKALVERNSRRLMAATTIVHRFANESDARERSKKIASLFALTSFEFFDALADGLGSCGDATGIILSLVQHEFAT